MTPPNDHARTVHGQATVVDLHAHPSMKTYFGNARLKQRYSPDPGLNIHELRTSYPSLIDGGIDVLCSAVYVPEHYLKKDCWVLALGSNVIPRLKEALEAPPDDIARRMIHHVESEVDDVNASNPVRPMAVVRSPAELQQVVESGTLAVIHTIEGGHALNQKVENVAQFADLGVACITLAHFYPNGISPPVEAIPDDMFLRVLGCFRFEEDLDAGLTPLGKEVVEAMFDRGILVDLTHSTPRARQDVYDLPNPKGRPLVMTHVGAHAARPVPMNPTDDEIRRIADGGGVIGVIFYNYWLTIQKYPGSDTLKHIIPNVRHLVDTGGEDCVAFGSDFDGMTDPPDDLREPADWPNLTVALSAAGFTDTQIAKFLGANARRALRDGWGP